MKCFLFKFNFKLNPQNGQGICKCLDVLEPKLKNDLIKWFLKKELSEYTVLFEENQEVFCLDLKKKFF